MSLFKKKRLLLFFLLIVAGAAVFTLYSYAASPDPPGTYCRGLDANSGCGGCCKKTESGKGGDICVSNCPGPNQYCCGTNCDIEVCLSPYWCTDFLGWESSGSWGVWRVAAGTAGGDERIVFRYKIADYSFQDTKIEECVVCSTLYFRILEESDKQTLDGIRNREWKKQEKSFFGYWTDTGEEGTNGPYTKPKDGTPTGFPWC